MRTRILLVLAGALAGLAWSTTASGAGPSPGVTQGANGLTRANVEYRTLPAGGATVLEVTNRTGRVLRQMRLAGAWGIPLVAYDNTVEGLLPDGRTLVLASANLYTADGHLRKPTTFKLVDTRAMKVTREIKLPGAFTFDAVSADGRYLYLIEFFSDEDAALYRVRAYDLTAGKLLARIVADRRSWETGMQGMPISRIWRGGWAYTLYGGNSRPFIHALNTKGVEAVCVNLPWQRGPQRVFDFRLRVDRNGKLVVRGPHGRALAVIDRESFKILSYVKSP
jgi:hypothetical protein